jgi:aminotransferase
MPAKQASGTDSAQAGASRWWEFDVQCAAGRHISNDVLAAIGRVQLGKLPGFIARRKAIWERYQACLHDVPGITIPPEPMPGCTSSYYLYWIQVSEQRDELAAWLHDKRGIYTTFRYYPLHLVPFYAHAGGNLPNAEWAADHTLCLPIHQNLTGDDVGRIIDSIVRFAREPYY